MYKKYEKREEECQGKEHLFHTLRMIEANIEKFPQLVLLLTFLTISNRLVFEAK